MGTEITEKRMLGYLFDEDGRYHPAVELLDVPSVFLFCENHKNDHYEVRIVDPVDDAIIVQAKKGRYIYPEVWLLFNEELGEEWVSGKPLIK